MKISKYAAHMMKDIISLFIGWAFLFNTSMVSAVGQPDNSSLSPQLSTTRQDSREKLSIAAGLITHAALNAHIRGEVEKIIKVRGRDYVNKLVNMGQPIPISDMIKITGCFGHVGLGQRYGKTVIYMDRDVSADPKDREDVMDHDNYESMEWEYIWRVLNIEPGKMRAWIIENIDTVVAGLADTKYKGKTVREIAFMIHKDAPSIDHLYEKYGVKIDVDIQHLIELLSRCDEVSIDDVLIVAGRPFPGLHGKRDIIIGAMLGDKYKVLLRELRQILNNDNVDFNRLSQFLTTCDYAASTQALYPVESRYPLLRAVALMEKAEQDRLIKILNDHPDIRALPIVDSILFMLDKSVPANWAKQHAPYLIGRRVWQVAAEIWNPAGGLGRVMQFHGLEMYRICKAVGIGYAQVEPYYDYGKNREGQYVKTDWAQILCVNPNDIKKLGDFPVMVGYQPAEAFSSEVITGAGIPEFLVGGRKRGQTHSYYTEGLYRYRNSYEPSLVSLQEFSAFISAASDELIKREEERSRSHDPGGWKPPVVHFNDGQLGMAPYLLKAYYRDTVMKDATVAYSSHTYGNRCFFVGQAGEDVLEELTVPAENRKYFRHHIAGFQPVVDLTSAGARTSDLYMGVARQHVEDITRYKYDNWGQWEDREMVAVTNGDVREFTAHVFREIMQAVIKEEVVQDGVDLEHPTPELVRKAKRIAKGNIGLDPNLHVLSYSGRCVTEKAGRERALTDSNIRSLIEMGVQVVIGANCSSDIGIVRSLRDLSTQLEKDKAASPGRYPGSFTLITNIDIETQRGILAASDAQVQDSDPHTEAAGYSEADVSACGGIEIAPPWREGILQAQGVPLDFEKPGEGNTVIVEIKLSEGDLQNIHRDENIRKRVEAAYLKAMRRLFSMGKNAEESLVKLSEYQATSVRLSRVLEARITAAEYLRQFNKAVAKKENKPHVDPRIIYQANQNIIDALKGLGDLSAISAGLKEGRVYEIRADHDRLAEIPYGVEIVDTYVELLKMRATDPKNIVLKYSGKEGLIAIQCYKNQDDYNSGLILGKGTVGVAGQLKNREINIVGLLNMAMAASNIRTALPTGETYDQYEKDLIAMIRDQYRQIYGRELAVAEEDILAFIKDLPAIDKPLGVDSMESYYKLTYERLQQSA